VQTDITTEIWIREQQLMQKMMIN